MFYDELLFMNIISRLGRFYLQTVQNVSRILKA